MKQNQNRRINGRPIPSRFTVELTPVTGDEVQVIVVRDIGTHHRSVTNDAENVVAWCVQHYGDYPILYLDSSGQWDALDHCRGVFTDFTHIGIQGAENIYVVLNKFRNILKSRVRTDLTNYP